jgi:hypothetical protein
MNISNFYHLPVKGDGACFFHSIAGINHLNEHLFKQNNRTITYKIEPGIWSSESMKLRKKCVQWLKNNLDYRIKGIGTTIRDEILEDVRTNNNITTKTIDGYFTYMSNIKGYAGQIEIYAISELLQKNVRTYISKDGKLSNVGLGYEIKPKDMMNDISLYHNLGDVGDFKGVHHFEILYPKKKATIVSKTEYMNTFKKRVKSLSKKVKKSTKKLSFQKRKRTQRGKTKRNLQKRNNTPRRKRK